MSATVILNGDQVYTEELVRENARLTVQVEAERQLRQNLPADLSRMRDERDRLAQQAEEAEENLSLATAGLEREKVLASKLGRAIHDLHFVMAGGDVCKVCKNKCRMGTAGACEPHWKGLDD